MNRRMKQGFAAGLFVAGLSMVAAGCLTRPVEHTDPVLKTNFTTVVENQTIDKIDILFDIDNSASMGDKQDYLTAAIPDLVNRLINPDCISPTGQTDGQSTNGTCANSADTLEFAPVHDLHLGIVSSSLGPRGGDVCLDSAMAPMPFTNVPAHNDDHAYLLNRSLSYSANGTSVTEGVVTDAPATDPYLYWFPAALNTGAMPGPGNPLMDTNASNNSAQLITDFSNMVHGTGVFGCGIESQLESWYRFLIQPDPYSSISINGQLGNAKGVWNEVDTTILQQRHDFLRPDSLVLVVVLSDENDSEIDVRSVGGLGVNWMAGAFQPPNGTSACNSNPASNSCQSCAQGTNGKTDSQCQQKESYTAVNDWGYDLNLRHVHMKAKYGIDPQYPIERYVTGLTSTTVPDRNGEYPTGATSYVGTNDCQNPLFAGQLPDGSKTDVQTLCHAPPGNARTKDLVFYAHIGGVPNQLLHFTPGDAAASTLTAADWVKILGNDPENYDYTGIDPHMIESYQPRQGLAPPGSPNGTDPINGHEWITNTSNGVAGYGNVMGGGHILAVDREYACIFPLVNSAGQPSPRDCTQSQNSNFCDCPHVAGSVNAQELPPICDQTTITTQTGAKAYPTIRELLLAKKMGNQGIVSSICPIDVADNATGDDPNYGYRPAVAVIIDRLKNALTNQCLPQQLTVTAGQVPCLILLQIPNGGAGMTSGNCLTPVCDPMFGLKAPDPDVLTKFCQNLEDQYNAQVSANGGSTVGITDPATVPVCELNQLIPPSSGNPNSSPAADFTGTGPNATCAASPDRGWCYVTGAAAGKCPQAIIFAPKSIPNGATSNLQCIEQSVSVLGSSGGSATSSSSGGGTSSSSSGGGAGG
jgi:hypothetical protein